MEQSDFLLGIDDVHTTYGNWLTTLIHVAEIDHAKSGGDLPILVTDDGKFHLAASHLFDIFDPVQMGLARIRGKTQHFTISVGEFAK